MNFDEMLLHPAILKAVTAAKYTVPTAIQAQAIPKALEGADLLASAQTGTGKTAAFVLPAMQLLSVASKIKNSKGPRILVLTPTRELAQQVTGAARQYGKFLHRVNVISLTGGASYARQCQEMSRAVEMMVATPGRLIDFLQRGKIDFRRIEMLVLDEADRMLDMGFRDDVLEIAKALPKPHQTLMFSATIGEKVHKLVTRLLTDPVRIEVSHQKEKHAGIEQQLYYVQNIADKERMLLELLGKEEVKQAIVFTATKQSAADLSNTMRARGTEVQALHGDMRQGERTRTIKALRSGGLRFLVATDVAARGINVAGVSHVINFDIPYQPNDYVHRIGRTGRAGVRGTAILLAYPKELWRVSKIESFIGHSIPVLTMPGFEVEMEPERRADRKKSWRKGTGAPRRNRYNAQRRGTESGAASKRSLARYRSRAAWSGLEGGRQASSKHGSRREHFAAMGKRKPAQKRRQREAR